MITKEQEQQATELLKKSGEEILKLREENEKLKDELAYEKNKNK